MTESEPENFFRERAKEFLDLHDQVQSSVDLLDSLEGFLSTFQNDLSAVSGQISELQERSKDIDNKLKSRRKIEKPLSCLITDITVSPETAKLLLDSDVSEAWIPAVEEFERRLDMIKSRSRVKAARDLLEVAEGLRIVTATKLRVFFHALFRPIRSSVTTNMQVIQSSVLLKYKSLFGFVKRQAPNVALELQKAYISAARVYYETGFRRYSRSLGYVKTRTSEKFESIVTTASSKGSTLDLARLQNAKIDGPAVTLAYMADDKTFKEPVEALLRSLLLVFMDNATSEYTFVSSFFAGQEALQPLLSNGSRSPLLSPGGSFSDRRAISGSEFGGPGLRSRSGSTVGPDSGTIDAVFSKEEQANSDSIWKQIFDPVLEYCQTFVRTTLDPPPPVVSLLTMIRLTENVVAEVQRRSCPPVESFVFVLRLQMWPVFQKTMSENVDALKKFAEGAGASTSYFGLGRSTATTDANIDIICQRYVTLFNSFITLTEQEEETMIFSNLIRMRQELVKLVHRHTGHSGNDGAAQAVSQANIYERILQGLSRGTQYTAHPKAQQENAFWGNLEEEARRKIRTMSSTRPR